MDSLSHRIARRLRGILAILLAAGALAAVPAHAATVAPSSKLVSANNIQSVIDYLESKGDKTERSKSDDGDPMLNESNNYYSVYFWCEDNHASCDAIQFRALGLVGQPAIDWQNRPTFQQVVEFPRHRPSGS